eukprot:6930293-Prymnesium_polylepis.2
MPGAMRHAAAASPRERPARHAHNTDGVGVGNGGAHLTSDGRVVGRVVGGCAVRAQGALRIDKRQDMTKQASAAA